jgi:glycosyltransferase involved in cell wall biosynthesis
MGFGGLDSAICGILPNVALSIFAVIFFMIVNMAHPLISICIPAYKKPQYVIRCLESVLQQDYRNVEVVISDDSPDEDIKDAIAPYTERLSIRYFHNQPALKSPRNWNNALDKANGELVMLLHQDDWLHAPDALSTYVNAFEDANVNFVFCRNTAVDEKGTVTVLQERKYLLTQMVVKPNHLLLSQIIGPPSNTMLRSSVSIRYDEQFIWVVDVDYYARLLKAGHKYRYIDRHLVSIGLHGDQTTVFCRTNDDIIFRENIRFAAKVEPEAFADPVFFDYYWRLLRTYKIRSMADVEANGISAAELPQVLLHMLKAQQRITPKALGVGPISKSFMLLCYTNWRLKTRGK